MRRYMFNVMVITNTSLSSLAGRVLTALFSLASLFSVGKWCPSNILGQITCIIHYPIVALFNVLRILALLEYPIVSEV